jgi:SNF2 family DNA or RNA helicase
VLNLAAGGVGLTLTAASNVAFVELGWTPGGHDQAEDRSHRLGQHDSVTAWYLLGEDTIDQDIYALIEEKRAVVTAATDGGIVVDETSIVGEIIERIRG